MRYHSNSLRKVYRSAFNSRWLLSRNGILLYPIRCRGNVVEIAVKNTLIYTLYLRHAIQEDKTIVPKTYVPYPLKQTIRYIRLIRKIRVTIINIRKIRKIRVTIIKNPRLLIKEKELQNAQSA